MCAIKVDLCERSRARARVYVWASVCVSMCVVRSDIKYIARSVTYVCVYTVHHTQIGLLFP